MDYTYQTMNKCMYMTKCLYVNKRIFKLYIKNEFHIDHIQSTGFTSIQKKFNLTAI